MHTILTLHAIRLPFCISKNRSKASFFSVAVWKSYTPFSGCIQIVSPAAFDQRAKSFLFFTLSACTLRLSLHGNASPVRVRDVFIVPLREPAG